jgi:sulfopyruvate decarboxylase alpha subunit
MQTAPSSDDWSIGVHAVFQDFGLRQVAYVPDAGLSRLLTLCQSDRDMRAVMLTTEEEGIGVLAGAWLGGEKGALLMQSSGVGNCINTFSLVQAARFPVFALVTMRGQWGEFNPWQVPMGQAVQGLLESCGVIVYPVEETEAVPETVAAGLSLAYDSDRAVAVLLSQRLLGSKRF